MNRPSLHLELIARKDYLQNPHAYPVPDRNGQNTAFGFQKAYIYLPTDVDFDPATGGFTIMFWLKVNKLVTNMTFFENSKCVGKNVTDKIFLKTSPDATMWIFGMGISDYTHWFESPKIPEFMIVKDVWFHVAVVISLDSLTIGGSYYVNGSVIYNGTRLIGNVYIFLQL
jgi:hypothetical protein